MKSRPVMTYKLLDMLEKSIKKNCLIYRGIQDIPTFEIIPFYKEII
jgi:hypothetical protein